MKNITCPDLHAPASILKHEENKEAGSAGLNLVRGMEENLQLQPAETFS